eukprot:gene6251-8610_t
MGQEQSTMSNQEVINDNTNPDSSDSSLEYVKECLLDNPLLSIILCRWNSSNETKEKIEGNRQYLINREENLKQYNEIMLSTAKKSVNTDCNPSNNKLAVVSNATGGTRMRALSQESHVSTASDMDGVKVLVNDNNRKRIAKSNKVQEIVKEEFIGFRAVIDARNYALEEKQREKEEKEKKEKELSTPIAFIGGIASIFTFQDEHINENGFKNNTNNNSDTPNSKSNNDNATMDIDPSNTPRTSTSSSSMSGANPNDDQYLLFSRYLSTSGIHCLFYPPDGIAQAIVTKERPATIRCARGSESILFEIAASGAGKKPKMLSFNVTDISSIQSGKGSAFPSTLDVTEELCCHISLINRPDINLGFENIISKNTFLYCMPQVLQNRRQIKRAGISDMVLSNQSSPSTRSTTDNHSHSVSANSIHNPSPRTVSQSFSLLKDTSRSLIKLIHICWVKYKKHSSKSFMITHNQFSVRLLLVTSENVLFTFIPPTEYNNVDDHSNNDKHEKSISFSSTASSVSTSHTHSNMKSDLMSYLNEQPEWKPIQLTNKGFERELLIPLSTVSSAVYLDKKDAINVHTACEGSAEFNLKVDTLDERHRLIATLLSCFWHVQHEFVETERRVLGRSDNELTSVAGYAGGTRFGKSNTNPSGRVVCYHNLMGSNDYGSLGHGEVVKLDIPPESLRNFAEEYFSLFGVDKERPDKGDVGPEYRSLIGIPGGVANAEEFSIIKEEADKKGITLKEGKGNDADTLGRKMVWVMDSNKFEFNPAEVYHQYHDGFMRGEQYPQSYNDLVQLALKNKVISPTGCPEI